MLYRIRSTHALAGVCGTVQIYLRMNRHQEHAVNASRLVLERVREVKALGLHLLALRPCGILGSGLAVSLAFPR